MKVLIFSHTYYPNKDGIAIHIYNLTKSLQKKEIDVEVVYPKNPIRIPGLSTPLPDIQSVVKLITGKYDIIHVHGYGNLFSIIGAFIGMLRGKPVVWTVHGIPDRHKLFKIYNAIAIHLLRRAKVISVSRKIEMIHKNYVLIYNGIDLDRFKCNRSYKESKYVTYIGRLDRDKGVDRLIDEYAGDIMVVGSDEDGFIHELKARSRGNVVFREVDYEQIVEIYCNSRYVVLPSRYEGFPMVMVESIACERPFIATPVGEIPTFLEYLFGNEYKKYLIDDDIGKIIDRLDRLDLSAELRRAREKLEILSWDSIAEQTIKVYRDALGR
ncbi:MAG: glycosyltransferase family 4 protein [Candidatus Anstonellales archaeon]